MHETHLIKNIFGFLQNEEESSLKQINAITMNLSEFGSFSKDHFMEHFNDEAKGTKWGNIVVNVNTIPYGPELEITQIEYKQ